ncbi:uncharacterized protein LOC135120016 [Zophobas morio]|uniref:uncharacterized protein LOC135120016 n=1 Tax=Zophobas morio TaxID=2755281 RepID=UPI0030829AB4
MNNLTGFETKTSSATKNSVVCKPFIENGSEENHSKDEVPKMFRDKDKEYTFTEKIDELYIKELVLKESSVPGRYGHCNRLKYTYTYVHDCLISSENKVETLQLLVFLKSTVKWLGKELSKEGSRMRIERVSLFKNIKPPENKKELSSLLHMLNYRGMYISTHAGILELLSRLLPLAAMKVMDWQRCFSNNHKKALEKRCYEERIEWDDILDDYFYCYNRLPNPMNGSTVTLGVIERANPEKSTTALWHPQLFLSFDKAFLNSDCITAKRLFRISKEKLVQTPQLSPTSNKFFLEKPGKVPFGWKSLSLFLVIGGAVYFYFKSEKKRVLEERRYKDSRGRPDVGGSFVLKDHEGRTVTENDLKNKWTLIYFGFTHCPDICPEELNKLTDVLNRLDKQKITKEKVFPYLVTVDPRRDTPTVLKTYLQDFHPRFIGLTGTEEDIKEMAKTFRVHYSRGPSVDDSPDDYIVDHSILTFFFDPRYNFCAFYSITDSGDKIFNEITNFIRYNPDL